MAQSLFVQLRSVSRSAMAMAFLVLLCLSALSPWSFAQEAGDTARKLVSRNAPAYPALARNMVLQGAVKVEAVVSPDGTVTKVVVKGGHPVLAQAAAKAVSNWRWQPAGHETRELVEVHFDRPE